MEVEEGTGHAARGPGRPTKARCPGRPWTGTGSRGFGHSGGHTGPIWTDGGLALLLPGSPGQMGGQSHAAAVFCMYFAPALTNSTNDKPNSHSVSLVPALMDGPRRPELMRRRDDSRGGRRRSRSWERERDRDRDREHRERGRDRDRDRERRPRSPERNA